MKITAIQCTLQFCREADTHRLLWHYQLMELRMRQVKQELRATCTSALALKYMNIELTMQLIWEELERRAETQLPDGLILWLIDNGNSFTLLGL